MGTFNHQFDLMMSLVFYCYIWHSVQKRRFSTKD